MVPTHFARLLALPAEVRARYDVSSVKLVGHTGSACPIDVKRQMIEWWGPVFFDAYGATEVGTTCMAPPRRKGTQVSVKKLVAAAGAVHLGATEAGWRPVAGIGLRSA